jgi:hypothetical protein
VKAERHVRNSLAPRSRQVVEAFRIPWAIYFITLLLISYILFIDYIIFIIYINKFNYYNNLNIKKIEKSFILFFNLYIFINLQKKLFILFLFIYNSFLLFYLIKLLNLMYTFICNYFLHLFLVVTQLYIIKFKY